MTLIVTPLSTVMHGDRSAFNAQISKVALYTVNNLKGLLTFGLSLFVA